MTEHDALYDNVKMKAEFNRIMEGIKEGQPVPSHLWLIVKHPGIDEGQWRVDNIEDYIDLIIDNAEGANGYGVWSDIPETNPMLTAPSNTRNDVLTEDGTCINLTDFIQAGITRISPRTLRHDMFVKLVAYHWRYVIKDEPAMMQQIGNALTFNH